jgi:bacterioferritin-associated ferredoxin
MGRCVVALGQPAAGNDYATVAGSLNAMARYIGEDKVMIVCSCNVLSDHQLRSTLAKAARRLGMSQIYDQLGSSARCGRCAHTIKKIMGEVTKGAIGPAAAVQDCASPKQR